RAAQADQPAQLAVIRNPAPNLANPAAASWLECHVWPAAPAIHRCDFPARCGRSRTGSGAAASFAAPGCPTRARSGMLRSQDTDSGGRTHPRWRRPSRARLPRHAGSDRSKQRPRHPGWLDHGTGPACRSSLGGSTDTVTEGVEVLGIRGPGRGGLRTLQQDVPQMLPVLVLTDQLTHVLTTRAVALLGDLFLDECLERVRQGDVHRAHG